MKIIPKLVMLFLAACATSYAETDVLRVKLDWLNAKECGIEGCKPRNVILRSGSSASFSLPLASELEERGTIDLFPAVHGKSVQLKIKRNKGSDTVAEIEQTFAMGIPQEVALKEMSLRVTITEEEPLTKK